VPEGRTSDPQAAWEQLEKALQAARRSIQEQRRQAADRLGEDKAAIFDAHLLILEDPEL
jgi:phosphotransferase system enzyme I (PtsI)